MNTIYSKDQLIPLRLDEDGARETLFAGDTKLVDDIMEGLDGAWDCVDFEKSTDVRSILNVTSHKENLKIYDIAYRCTGTPVKLLSEFKDTFVRLGYKDRTIYGISSEGIGLRVFLFKLARLGCEVILEFVDVNGDGQAWKLIFQDNKPHFYLDNSLLTNIKPGLKFQIRGVEYGNKTLAQDLREKVSITYFKRYDKARRDDFGVVETYINDERVVMFDPLLGFIEAEDDVSGNEVLKDTLFRGVVKRVKTTSGNIYRLYWSHAIHSSDDQTKKISTHPAITGHDKCQSSIARKSLKMKQKDSGVFLDKSGRLSGIGNKNFGYTLNKDGDINSARTGGDNLAGLRIIVENITPQAKLNSIGNEFKTEFSLPNKNENKLQSGLQNPAYKELNREINKICKEAVSRFTKLTETYRGDYRRDKAVNLKNKIAKELNSKFDTIAAFPSNPSKLTFDKNLDSKAGYKILPNGGVDSNQDKLLEVIINPESEFYKGSTNKPQANDSMVVKTIASTIESIRDMSTSDFNKIKGVDSE